MNLRRRMTFSFILLASGFVAEPLAAQPISGPLVSQITAQRFGLERSWFTQVQLDRSRSRMEHVTLAAGTVFAQTNQGLLQAIDAESGRTMWTVQVGAPTHPDLAPAANEKYVAVLNGSWLYVLQRSDGRAQWQKQMGGVPNAGPILTDSRVFVPMLNGTIESYELEAPKSTPWIYASEGRIYIPPIATEKNVCWVTDAGHLYVAQAENPKIRFRIETGASIEAPPTYRSPNFFVSSLDGYVYAVDESTGYVTWRFAAGDPVSEPPTVIDDRLYICPDHAGMYCISAENGAEIWWTPGPARFLASSGDRIYATDKRDKMFILDVATGARLGAMRLEGIWLWYTNNQTDRIYLGTDTGLLQCLHQANLQQPLQHPAPSEEPEEGAKEPPKEEPAPEAPEAPAEAEPAPAANPFGGGGADPFGGQGGGADPFGQ